MSDTQNLAALQQELAETKRALAETKRALADANLRDQRSRAIREDIARRRFTNPAAVEALVDQQIVPLEDGRLVVVDGNGVPVIGSSDGAYKTVADLLDELEKNDTDSTSHDRSNTKSNPFVNSDTTCG